MNARGLLNWFLSPSFDHYGMSQYDTENVARMICNEGVSQKTSISCADYKFFNVSKIDIQLYKSDFLNPVAEIYNTLNNISSKHIKHFLLHGSLSDFKYSVGWSDLDTLVVISDDVFENYSELMDLRSLFSELNKLLLKIDSIAHHGFIIVLESDLENYGDFLIPICVINTARNIYGSGELRIRKSNVTTDWIKKIQGIKDTFLEFGSSGVFRHHPYKGKYLTKDMIKQNDGMYQFKYLIGMVMILPSIYYTAIGSPVYKAKSFEPFLRKFPTSSIVKCVSQIRTDWAKTEQYPYVPNRIPDWLVDRLPQDYVSEIIELLDDIIVDLKKSKQ